MWSSGASPQATEKNLSPGVPPRCRTSQGITNQVGVAFHPSSATVGAAAPWSQGVECPELFTLGWKTLRKMLWGWVEVGDKMGLCFKKSSALSSKEKEADQPQGASPSLCLYPSWGAAGSLRRGRASMPGLQFLSLKTGL